MEFYERMLVWYRAEVVEMREVDFSNIVVVKIWVFLIG